MASVQRPRNASLLVLLPFTLLLLVLLSSTEVTAYGSRKPVFGARSCGGAMACVGKRNLTRALVKSGLSARTSVAELAELMDRDSDLGIDQKSGRLLYACSGLALENTRARAVAPAAALGLLDAPERAVVHDGTSADVLQQQTAPEVLLGRHRRLAHSQAYSRHKQQEQDSSSQQGQDSSSQQTPPPRQQGRHVLQVAPADELVCPSWQSDVPDAAITVAAAFTLHSRPNATRKIFLDFDGHITTGAQWNAVYGHDTIITPAFDKDGSPSTWSASELSDILAIWRAVSEDYAPFDVDVTTEDPGDAYLATYGIRVAIGGSSSDWLGSAAGGVAWLNSFGQGTYLQPCFVFQEQLGGGYAKYVFEAVSHEVGHTLGLSHDGTTADGSAYFEGHGDWAPIMGSAYTKQMSQFSKGEYAHANNQEDDFAIISQTLPYIAQQHGSTLATATPLTPTTRDTKLVTNKVAGVLRHPADVDVFSVRAQPGTMTLSVMSTPAWGAVLRSDLNLQLQLLNAAGTVLATVVGVGVGPLKVTLPAKGTYYVRVSPAGNGDPVASGYSSYGSRGQYKLSLIYPRF